MTWSAAYLSIPECVDVRGTAVVVDVMRAFTTAAWALHLGAERLVLTDRLDEALALKAAIPGALALKDGEPLPGFDLTNSPARLQERSDLKGRTIVQRTTAGTVGAVAARAAARLFCASFVCASATAAAVREAGPASVTFVVTGNGGKADEDRAAAEYIAALLTDPTAAPEPYLARAARSESAANLAAQVASGARGVDQRDVFFCLEANRFAFALRAVEEAGLLSLRPYRPAAQMSRV